MSNTPHDVQTSHGTVRIFGYDIANYDDVEQWIKDHQAVIGSALSAASLLVAGTSFYVTHVKRK